MSGAYSEIRLGIGKVEDLYDPPPPQPRLHMNLVSKNSFLPLIFFLFSLIYCAFILFLLIIWRGASALIAPPTPPLIRLCSRTRYNLAQKPSYGEITAFFRVGKNLIQE